MSSRTMQVSIAVAAALVVIVLFFIFNPFTSMQDTNALNPAGDTTGLVAQDEVVGTGAVAQPGDLISVNYTGTFADGSVFDTSIGKPPAPGCAQGFCFTLGTGMVISGWDQGLVGMKVGGKRKLTVPPSLGYGSQDYGPIPGNSTLTFEVELLDVASSAPTAPQGASAN